MTTESLQADLIHAGTDILHELTERFSQPLTESDILALATAISKMSLRTVRLVCSVTGATVHIDPAHEVDFWKDRYGSTRD